MLDKNVVKLLNEQIAKELYSAYLYLDFAGYFYDEGLDGFANWYRIQAQEERDHAMMFYDYLVENGYRPDLCAIDKPDKQFKSHAEVLDAGLAHEEYVTSLINTIYSAASEVKDYRTLRFLDYFITEQGEEEANAQDLIQKLKLFGSDPKGLYLLNKELGERVYTAPAASAT